MLKRLLKTGLTCSLMLGLAWPVMASPHADLLKAVEEGNLKAAQQALQHRANPNLELQANTYTAFETALWGEDLAMIELLHKAGGRQATLLSVAEMRLVDLARSKEPARLAILRYFLAQKVKTNFLALCGSSEDFYCNRNTIWTTKKTPLHFAVRESSLEAAKLLLAAGMSINIVNEDGATPLMLILDGEGIAFTESPAERLQMIRFLLARGASVGPRDKYGRTALQIMLQSQINEALPRQDFLALVPQLGQSTDPLYAMAKQASPWNLALDDGDPALVKCVLALVAPANRSIALKSGVSKAAASGKFELLKFLLEQGAELATRDAQGHSLLQLAAHGHHPESGSSPK